MKRARVGQFVEAFGVVAAMVLAVLVNVLAARHYRRWDMTRHQLYTLSPATLETLHALGENVEIDVLLSTADPLANSVKFLLSAYQAETDRLVVKYTDPDRHAAEFLAAQQKYGIQAGRTEEGVVVTDAVVIMSRAHGKPFFLSTAELVDEREDGRGRSKVEQAFTLTLRKVMSDARPRICFVAGHGERRLDDGGTRGLGELAARLKKNNYDADEVDTSAPNAKSPLDGCRVAVIVGPTQPFDPEDVARLRSWFESGGNVFLLTSPVPDTDKKRMLALGLGPLTQAAGIALDEAFVFELDPARKLPGGFGEQFLAEPKVHEITLGLIGEKNRDLKILMTAARPLSATGGAAPAAELLGSSGEAFGMTDFFGWAERGGAPEKGAGDRQGPLALAMAAELPDKPAGAAHGPRMVVVGTSSLALGQNWREQVLRGGAIFTESALSWLAAEPPLVDIPDKPAVTGARLNEASLGEVLRYVVFYMPGAVLLLAIAVYLRRRVMDASAAGD
ncbi:MAG TPA: GldG family protein [Polyangiaceae bacterium]|nr:GldG family protein [Polyangiaceae bacterium]